MRWFQHAETEAIERQAERDEVRLHEIQANWLPIFREVMRARDHRRDNGFVELVHTVARGNP